MADGVPAPKPKRVKRDPLKMVLRNKPHEMLTLVDFLKRVEDKI